MEEFYRLDRFVRNHKVGRIPGVIVRWKDSYVEKDDCDNWELILEIEKRAKEDVTSSETTRDFLEDDFVEVIPKVNTMEYHLLEHGIWNQVKFAYEDVVSVKRDANNEPVGVWLHWSAVWCPYAAFPDIEGLLTEFEAEENGEEDVTTTKADRNSKINLRCVSNKKAVTSTVDGDPQIVMPMKVVPTPAPKLHHLLRPPKPKPGLPRKPKVKEFPCKLCDRVYTKNSNRKRHEDKIHFKKVWRCMKCEKVFKNKQSCSKHERECNYVDAAKLIALQEKCVKRMMNKM